MGARVGPLQIDRVIKILYISNRSELDTIIWPSILLLIALFVGGAFFSGVETALIAMSHHRLKLLREENPSKADAISRWLENPNRMLTTMLIGINVVGISSAIIAENIADKIVKHYHLPHWCAPLISFGFVSLVVIEFCEIIPKILAYNNAEKYALRMIKPLVFIDRLFSPIGRVMVSFGNIVIQMFGGKPGSPQGAFITEAEILGLVDSGEQQGVIDKEEREMIRSIFEFGDTQVREVMTPKPYMHVVPSDMSVSRMAQMIEEIKHSRFPVYESKEENIVGIINSKALLKALKEGRDNEPIGKFMHPPYFVPETKMIDDLLHVFQSHHIHIAVVVDEYGSTVGLVTLEDLIEEIVGEIRDEYDTEEPLYRWIAADALRVDARIDVGELNEVIGSDFPDTEDYESLGGFIFNELGRVPKAGDLLKIDNYEMTIEKMAGRRIASVVVRKKEPPPVEEGDVTI